MMEIEEEGWVYIYSGVFSIGNNVIFDSIMII